MTFYIEVGHLSPKCHGTKNATFKSYNILLRDQMQVPIYSSNIHLLLINKHHCHRSRFLQTQEGASETPLVEEEEKNWF